MSEMDKKRREAIRYLGFGRNAADERTYELIEASFDRSEQGSKSEIRLPHF